MSARSSKVSAESDTSLSPNQPAPLRPGEFKGQGSEADLFDYALCELRQGTLLDGVQLANVVEHGPDRPLPRPLREYVGRMLRHEIPLATPRGRKPKSQAWLDFTLLKVDEHYRRYRRHYEAQKLELTAATGKPPSRGAPSPSELAYRRILQDMRRDFPNLDWKALRNQHSKWRQGKLPSLRPHPDEPPEF